MKYIHKFAKNIGAGVLTLYERIKKTIPSCPALEKLLYYLLVLLVAVGIISYPAFSFMLLIVQGIVLGDLIYAFILTYRQYQTDKDTEKSDK